MAREQLSLCFLKKDNQFLLINRNKPPFMGQWNAVGGHKIETETIQECAKREVFEETGLKIKINTDTRQEYTYENKDSIVKNCIYFCSEFKNQTIKLQQEEISQSWLVEYDKAMMLLNYPQDKIILEKADKMYD